MLTKCNFCGIHSRIMRESNGCHACQRGWMVKDKEWEDNPYFLTKKEIKETEQKLIYRR